jgi:hypothetical protein
MLGFDKGTCAFINHLIGAIPGSPEFLLLDEAAAPPDLASRRMACRVITVPGAIRRGMVPDSRTDLSIPVSLRREISGSEAFSSARRLLLETFPDLSGEAASFLMGAFIDYSRFLIKRFRPKVVLLWNKFCPFHMTLDHIAKQDHLSVLYMEFGVLPGTFCFEARGQMGESGPARGLLNGLTVSREEYGEAAACLADLKRSGLNRNVQPTESVAERIKVGAKAGRPRIFYAGQNDCESGLRPYDEHARRFHSPVFASSEELLVALDQLAQKNDWNLIYKPHPLARPMKEEFAGGQLAHTLVLDEANINEVIDLAEVTVTILSQTAYIALIREKPVVMAGYTQLKGTGSTYEAFSRESLERMLINALENGLTPTQREAFVKHAALLWKHYLYDDMTGQAAFPPGARTIESLVETLANSFLPIEA